MTERDLINELEHLEATAYNLRLYLDYVREQVPYVWKHMEDRFSGMPGYVPVVDYAYDPED